MEKEIVSIIIPTKNSEKDIERCLISAKNQTYNNTEIIVVDNNSHDDTKDIAKRYAKVYNKGPERSTQRNYAAKIANGKFIFLIDSDMELPKEMVKECVAEVKGKDAVLMEDNGIGATFWSKAHAFEKAIHFNDREVTSPRFINRKKFLEMGGLDEDLVFNEDLDLHKRMKKADFKIGHVNLLINHYESDSLLKVIKKYFYYGTTAGKFFKKNPKQGAKLYILYHPLIFLKNWRYFLKHPIYGSGSIIRKFIEYGSAGMGMIYNYLKK